MDTPPSHGDPLHPVAASVDRTRALYDPAVRWAAPRRGLAISGREALVAHLLREAHAMREPELQPLRRTESGPHRVVEESAIRFVYAGEGIAGLALPAGSRVELSRVRVLELRNGRIVAETCIETFSPLGAPDGSSAVPAMALPERCGAAP